MQKEFVVGEQYNGTIKMIQPFGLFVELYHGANHILGIVHLVPQLTALGYSSTNSFQVGESVLCRILEYKSLQPYLDLIEVK